MNVTDFPKHKRPQPPDGSLKVLNGGNSVILKDDHCYIIKNYVNGEWRTSAHIFEEARKIIASLPPLDA